jgi:endoglucanase
MKKLRLALVIILISVAPLSAQNEGTLLLNKKGYLSSETFSVLPFLSGDPVGKQGGIELILYNQRIASNGSISIVPKATKNDTSEHHMVPIPKTIKPERVLDFKNNSVKLLFTHNNLRLNYLIETKGSGQKLYINIIPKKVDTTLVNTLWFNLELYPQAFAGKTFHSGLGHSGILDHRFTGTLNSTNQKPLPLAMGSTISIAPESPERNLNFSSESGPMILEDERGLSDRNWLKLKMPVRLTPNDTSTLVISYQSLPGWIREPVVSYSQAGYHPNQEKRAIIELSQNDQSIQKASLQRISPTGIFETVKSEIPKTWGAFLRYQYKVFDFSAVRREGTYRLVYGETQTTPFEIKADLYKNKLWQPSIQTFLPVQMCHMRVQDRGHLWHSACHVDDALQVPAPMPFFDGFYQSDSIWSSYAPNTTIPELNKGGWHDAGDDDINTGSTGRATYHLALIAEEFAPDIDQTSIDFEKKEAYLHTPDGKNDVLQQLSHGLDFLLGQYRAMDHSIVGVISSDWDTYALSGAWGMMTDHKFYNPELKEDSVTAYYSGKKDDRYAFTDKDTRREYFMAGVFAASYRAIKKFTPKKAEECLKNAKQIWEREKNLDPVIYNSVGTPQNLIAEKANAAVELFLSTNDPQYLDFIMEEKEAIFDNFSECAWSLSRINNQIKDKQYLKSYHKFLIEYAQDFSSKLKENPYGIQFQTQVWGIGWNLLWHMQKHYYLIKNHNDLFPDSQLFNVLNYVLGCHPGSNLSFVSGIGAHPPIPAFGVNRSDFAFITGGVYSGTNLSLPDFPELKADHPFLWQQSEYIVFGATPFVFCVLAADTLTNDKEK